MRWRAWGPGALDFTLVSVALAFAVNYASGATPPRFLSPVQRHPWILLAFVLGAIALRGRQRLRHRPNVWDGPADPSEQWSHLLPQVASHVQRDWIDGVLRPSLRLLEQPVAPRLQERAEAVVTQPGLVRRPADKVLPDGADIVAAYDYAHGRLLILGSPGVGKTTALLTLAQSLLTRHEADETVPVVLHASTWSEEENDFAVWLTRELMVQYRLPASAAWSFTVHGRVVPLVDGVDELPEPRRSALLGAVTAYQGRAGIYPLVVCCRVREYERAAEPLMLDAAVEICPLAPADLDRWVGGQRDRSPGLRALLDGDPELRDLAATPLLLGALAAVAGDLPSLEMLDRDGKRGAVLGAYVNRALTDAPRSRLTDAAPADRLRADLAVLAAFMRVRKATVFDPDAVGVELLLTRRQARFWVYGSSLFAAAVMAVAASWPAGWNPTGGGSRVAIAAFLIFSGLVILGSAIDPSSAASGAAESTAVVRQIFAFLHEMSFITAIVWIICPRQGHIPRTFAVVMIFALASPVVDIAFRPLRTALPATGGPPRHIRRSGLSPGRIFAVDATEFVVSITTAAEQFCYLVAIWLALTWLKSEALTGSYKSVVTPQVLQALCRVWVPILASLKFVNSSRAVSALYARSARAMLVRRRALPSGLPELLDQAHGRLLMFRSGEGYRFSHQLILDKLASEASEPRPPATGWQLHALGVPLVAFGTITILPARYWESVAPVVLVYSLFIIPATGAWTGLLTPIPSRLPIWGGSESAPYVQHSTLVSAVTRRRGALAGWMVLAIAAVLLLVADVPDWPHVEWQRSCSLMCFIGFWVSAVFFPRIRFVSLLTVPSEAPPSRRKRQADAQRTLTIEEQRAAVRVAYADPYTRHGIQRSHADLDCATRRFLSTLTRNDPGSQAAPDLIGEAMFYGLAASMTKAWKADPVQLLPASPFVDDRPIPVAHLEIVQYAAFIGMSLGRRSSLGRRIFVFRLKRQSRMLQSHDTISCTARNQTGGESAD